MRGVRRGGEGCVYAHVSGAGRRGKISVLDSTRECDTARHGKKSEREEQARRERTCMYSTIASGGGAEPASCRLHCGSGDGDGVWGIVRELVR